MGGIGARPHSRTHTHATHAHTHATRAQLDVPVPSSHLLTLSLSLYVPHFLRSAAPPYLAPPPIPQANAGPPRRRPARPHAGRGPGAGAGAAERCAQRHEVRPRAGAAAALLTDAIRVRRPPLAPGPGHGSP
jgi:hypothetical protein